MIQRSRIFLALAAVLLAVLPQPSVQAQTGGDEGFQGYLQLLGARARSEGVSEATIQRMTWGLTYNSRVVELDRGQPGIAPVPPPVAP